MTNPYDVIIDGKGYIIKEGTYVAAKRPVAADQFRTGDVSYENLSDQQAWAQSDWRGGFNQVYDVDRSKFFYSENIDILNDSGSFQLTNLVSAIAYSSSVNIDPNAAVKTRFSKYSTTYNWFVAGNSTLSYQYTTSLSSLVNLSGTIVDLVSTADKLYASVADHDILWASSNPTAATSWTAELSGNGYTPADMAIVNDQFYFTNASRTLFKYDGTGSTGVANVRQFNKYLIMNIVEFNGRLYLGCRDAQNLNKCILKVFDGSTDYDLYTWENTNTTFSSFDVMVNFNGKLYWNITGYRSNASIYSFDGQNIVEEFFVDDLTPSAYSYYVGIQIGSLRFAGFHDAVVMNGLLFIVGTYTQFTEGGGNGSIDVWATNGSFWYKPIKKASAAPFGQPGSTTIITRNNNTIDVLADLTKLEYQQNLSAYESTGKISSSIIDMNLFSINKKVNQLEIYHSSLPNSALVQGNLFFYGDDSSQNATATITNTTPGSTFTFLKIPDTYPDAKSYSYQVLLSCAGNTATPFVTDIVMRYILSPEYKKVWTFDIVVTDNLELQDGSKETRDSRQLRKDLETSASKGNVSFEDVDGTVFDMTSGSKTNLGVNVRDIQFKGPYDFASDTPEYIATITITEV